MHDEQQTGPFGVADEDEAPLDVQVGSVDCEWVPKRGHGLLE